MKAMLIALLLSSGQAIANEATFSCVNNMFREAKLTYSTYQVSIQDHHVAGLQDLETILEKRLNLDLSLMELELIVDKERGACVSSNPLEVTCGSLAQKGAVRVKGWSNGEFQSAIDLTMVVELHEFDLRSTLSEGTVVAQATALVELEGQKVPIAIDTFFYSAPENELSNCKLGIER